MKDEFKKLSEEWDETTKNIVGSIVEKTKHVESFLEILLSEYLNCSGDKYSFVREVLFSNYFFDFGKKINLFKNLNLKERWLKGKDKEEFIKRIIKISKTRNAFAHDIVKGGFGGVSGMIMFDYRVRSFEGEDFKLIDYKESFNEFNDNCSYVIEKIIAINEVIIKKNKEASNKK